MQNLDGDCTVVTRVTGEEYRRHPAPADLSLDFVPPGERRANAISQVHYGDIVPRRTGSVYLRRGVAPQFKGVPVSRAPW